MSKPGVFIALAMALAYGSNDAIAQDKFFDSNGVRIRYVEQGVGEPVVLVHGQGGSLDSWRDSGAIDALSKHYRVVALDQRGFGKSDKPHEPSAYGSQMGEDISYRLLGTSRCQARPYRRVFHGRARHIVAPRQSARTVDHRDARRVGTYYVDTPEQRRRFEEQAKQAQSGLSVEAVKQRNPGWTDAQAATYIAKLQSANDFLAIAANYRGTSGLFISEKALGITKVPVLHVVGSLETNMAESRHFIDTVLRSAEFVIVSNANHNEAMRRKEFVEAVESFLARHRSVR